MLISWLMGQLKSKNSTLSSPSLSSSSSYVTDYENTREPIYIDIEDNYYNNDDKTYKEDDDDEEDDRNSNTSVNIISKRKLFLVERK